MDAYHWFLCPSLPPRRSQLDYTTNQAAGEKYGIQMFPTLKLFKNSQFTEDYNVRTVPLEVD